MKKLILILFLLLCFAPPSYARMVIGSGAAVGDTCPGTTGLRLSWHLEDLNVTLGTPPGCSSAGTTFGAEGGTLGTGTPSPYDGTHSGHYTGGQFHNIADANLADPTKGTVDFWFNLTTYGVGGSLFYIYDTGDVDYISAIMVGGPQIRFKHVTALHGREIDTALSGNIQTATWYHVKARWDTTVHGSDYLKICIDTTTGEGNCVTGTSDLGSFGTAIVQVRVGDVNSSTAVVNIDAFKIYGSWQ